MEELIKKMRKDPELQVSESQIEEWIEEITDKGFHYLEGKTYEIIEKEKEEALQEYPSTVKEAWLQSLKQYRVVYDIQDVVHGQYARWLYWTKNHTRIPDEPVYGNALHRGGTLTHIRFTGNDVYFHVLFNPQKNFRGSFSLNSTILFQRISPEEHMVLLSEEGDTSP